MNNKPASSHPGVTPPDKIILLLTAILTLTLASYGDENGIGAITSGAPVIYDSKYIADIAEAKNVVDFSYILDWNEITAEPLNHIMSGSPSVKVNDGKVTISLGVPNPAYMDTFNNYIPDGITVTPGGVNILVNIDIIFFTSDLQHALFCIKDENNYAYLGYVDKDVTVKGTYTEGDYTEIYDVSLKKGWNYFIITTNGARMTLNSSETLPGGYNWVVFDADKLLSW